jgi:hypothetical protein
MNNLGTEHQLMLARKIMKTIEEFNRDHGMAPCPGVIRDTLLVAAGLLHQEAVGLEDHEAELDELQDSFSEVAKVCLEKALEASAHVVRSLPQ